MQALEGLGDDADGDALKVGRAYADAVLLGEFHDAPRQPLTHMGGGELRVCCFRVLYYKRRMAVEFFHSLTDGTGGMVFIRLWCGTLPSKPARKPPDCSTEMMRGAMPPAS